MTKKCIIIGYTVDSCILAREMANDGYEVKYILSGKLAYPYDTINDFIDENTKIRLDAFKDIYIHYTPFVNYTYVHVPYDDIKFVNSRNGLLNWPISKLNFDIAEEWEQIYDCISNLNGFVDALHETSNYINIYKNFFPKWLYESVLKNMGINKWVITRQSKLHKDGLIKEVNLINLGNSAVNIIYQPTHGYVNLCNELLSHDKIQIQNIHIDDIRKFIDKRHSVDDIIIMDNRIDYIFDYVYGAFDRINIKKESIDINKCEEFIDIDQGIVYTPNKPYWSIISHKNEAYKLYSNMVDEIGSNEQNIISPTVNNNKIYTDYKKLINLFSNKSVKKKLTLKSVFNTTII